MKHDLGVEQVVTERNDYEMENGEILKLNFFQFALIHKAIYRVLIAALSLDHAIVSQAQQATDL